MDNITSISDFVHVSNIAFGLGLSGVSAFVLTIILYLLKQHCTSQCVVNVKNDIHDIKFSEAIEKEIKEDLEKISERNT